MRKLSIILALMGFLLSACFPTTSANITGVWELVSYGDPANPTLAVHGVETSIEFKADGTLTGNVGCNGFGGDYDMQGEAIEFGPIVSTEMFCEMIADQESGVLTVFFESSSYALEGNTLTITTADGSSAVVLKGK